jgi:glycosyltransferase involved in cell wall biosynthesis
MKYQEALAQLKKENIKTWFDLDLFLDRLKDRGPRSPFRFTSWSKFAKYLSQGIGFITFNLGVDGVSIEKIKYAQSLTSLLSEKGKVPPIYWIAGNFSPQSVYFSSPQLKKLCLSNIDGFDKWGWAYFALFHTKLERGSEEYNALPPYIWEEALSIFEKIGQYVEHHQIKLLLVTNINSNPGNFALALAMVLLSEMLNLPVINSNHDFYWEQGKRKEERKPNESPGPRDHFFLNANVGEVFSLQQTLYPWDSRLWVQVNINTRQCDDLKRKLGINPQNVLHLTTAVDTNAYRPLTEEEKRDVYRRLAHILSPQGEVYTQKYNYSQLLSSTPVVLGWRPGEKFDFTQILYYFLQPTRIITRKRIEKDIELIEALFKNSSFSRYFNQFPEKEMVLHITGPIAAGHKGYLRKIQKRLGELYQTLPLSVKKRFKVIFTFGTRIESFPTEDKEAVLVSELYGISSLIFLPSTTEGRGLPIIESASARVPIVCSRYQPEEVYREVVGENLPSARRIEVLEYPEGKLPARFVQKVALILTDENERAKFTDHNRSALENRYTYHSLKENFRRILEHLRTQTSFRPREKILAKKALEQIYQKTSRKKKRRELQEITATANKTYLPGYGILGFLFYLKSLIDPSYFREEERELRSRIYAWAEKITQGQEFLLSQQSFFFNCLERLFWITEGEEKIRIDFSFNYRHRTKTHYLYRDLTEQELKGAVVLLAREILGKNFSRLEQEDFISPFYRRLTKICDELANTATTWEERINLLLNFSTFCPDDFLSVREFLSRSPQQVKAKLTRKVKSKINDLHWWERQIKIRSTSGTILHLCGKIGTVIGELKFLIEPLLKEWQKEKREVELILAAKRDFFGDELTVKHLKDILSLEEFSYLHRLKKEGKLKIIATGSLSAGTNLYQASPTLIREIKAMKKKEGFIMASGEDNYFTLDLLDVNSFRWGKIDTILAEKMIGQKKGSSFFQFIPAGMRSILSYPTPLQNAVQFSQLLSSADYQKLLFKYGKEEKKLLFEIKKIFQQTGMTLRQIFKAMLKKSVGDNLLQLSYLSGVYKDGHPWSGVYARISLKKRPMRFVLTLPEVGKKESVLEMAKKYTREHGNKIEAGWNGGYILNAELVGKLGLPDSYIGTPLGLIVVEGEIKSLPLYNRPVFLMDDQGKIKIKKVTLNSSGCLYIKERESLSLTWEQDRINFPSAEGGEVHLYNLLYPSSTIPLEGRVGLRIAGRKIIEIIKGKKETKVVPIGVFLTVPEEIFQKEFAKIYQVGKEVGFSLGKGEEWEKVQLAVEAGPLLVEKGKVAIDLEGEGWKTENSIMTQAAHSDYPDLRRPMLGVGIDGENNLLAIAINGRIRESVGSTYEELARILIKQGCREAMSFDPGGSATLLVQGKVRNIPPYNSKYEQDPYSLPPEPRFVGNAILGFWEK